MSFDYQFTMNAFSTNEFSLGPLSFPAETVHMVFADQLATQAPIGGLGYRVNSIGDAAHPMIYYDVYGNPGDPSWQILYAPGKHLLDSLDTTAGLFKISVFAPGSGGIETDTFFVSGTVSTPHIASVSTPEPTTLPLLMSALFVGWLVTRYRARMEQKTDE